MNHTFYYYSFLVFYLLQYMHIV